MPGNLAITTGGKENLTITTTKTVLNTGCQEEVGMIGFVLIKETMYVRNKRNM